MNEYIIYLYLLLGSIGSVVFIEKLDPNLFKVRLFLFESLLNREKRLQQLYHKLLYSFESFSREEVVDFELNDFGEQKSIINHLLRSAKTYGLDYKPLLQHLRSLHFQKIKYSKRIKDFILAGAFQFLLISFLCWSLVLFSEFSLGLSLAWENYLFISLWQFLGFSLYFVISYLLHLYFIDDVEQIEYSFFTFWIGSEAALPIKEVVKEARIEKIENLKRAKVSTIKDRLLQLVSDFVHQGRLIEEEIIEIKMQLFELKDLSLSRFSSAVQALRLGIILLFFLSSYLFALYGIGQHLLK